MKRTWVQISICVTELGWHSTLSSYYCYTNDMPRYLESKHMLLSKQKELVTVLRVGHSNSDPMKHIILIFWDLTPCICLKVSRHFGVRYQIHLQRRRISQVIYFWLLYSSYLFLMWFSLQPWRSSRYVRPTHLLNLMHYAELYLTRCNSSQTAVITNNSVALVCGRTIPTERPRLVGEISANFCG
jgi:hypothetical protein